MKKLVVCYSLSGNTKFVAEKIARQIDADLCEVADKKHKKGKLLYLTGGFAAFRQKLTEIEASKTIEDYDLVVVGSPVWAGKITPAIRTFLAKNDFSEKQVAYFITLGGDKPEKSLKNLRKTVVPKSVVAELAIINNLDDKRKAEKQIVEWCLQLPK